MTSQQFKIKTVNHKFRGSLQRRNSTTHVVIHHSATGYDVGAARIHEWHLGNGWAGIGYHYVITKQGIIETGRPEDVIGAHAIGANGNSIGVCLAGDFSKERPTDIQLQALSWLIGNIRTRYPSLKVAGHKDFTPTACPGDLFPWDKLNSLLTGKAKGGKEGDVLAVFKDVINHWAKADIEWLVDKGLLAKDENFRPNDYTTRAETAVLLKRVIDYVIKEVVK